MTCGATSNSLIRIGVPEREREGKWGRNTREAMRVTYIWWKTKTHRFKKLGNPELRIKIRNNISRLLVVKVLTKMTEKKNLKSIQRKRDSFLRKNKNKKVHRLVMRNYESWAVERIVDWPMIIWADHWHGAQVAQNTEYPPSEPVPPIALSPCLFYLPSLERMVMIMSCQII